MAPNFSFPISHDACSLYQLIQRMEKGTFALDGKTLEYFLGGIRIQIFYTFVIFVKIGIATRVGKGL